jgi:hypothetical protein
LKKGVSGRRVPFITFPGKRILQEDFLQFAKKLNQRQRAPAPRIFGKVVISSYRKPQNYQRTLSGRGLKWDS